MRRVKEEVRLVRLDRKVPEHWALIPVLTARLAEWCVRFGQGDTETFIAKVEASFVLGVATTAVWVVLSTAEPPACERMIGHCVASEDWFSGRKVGFINQLVIDSGRLPWPLRRDGLCELEQWARSIGASELMMMTPHLSPKAWRRYAGFEPYRLLGRKEVG